MTLDPFYFQILGANSAVPTVQRFPSSFILGYREHLMLIDCGEGSQIKMSEYRVQRSRIDHIFISHLHGDHLFGLPGLLNSFTLSGRHKDLHLFGPPALESYITSIIEHTGGYLGYNLIHHPVHIEEPTVIGRMNGLEVTAYPLDHRIETYGYRFEEVGLQYNIRKEAIKEYGLSIEEIKQAKKGQDVFRESGKLSVDQLTQPLRSPRSFAYCSDTAYKPDLVEVVNRVDLLYHEATYLDDLADKAAERKHSTSKEAATIAADAGVGQLIIGHYSSRYKELEPLLEEAQSTFPNTALALSGERFDIPDKG